MGDEPGVEDLVEEWQRRKQASDELTQRYLWSTVTTPVMPLPELQTSLTKAALDHIAESRARESEAWGALAAYLGRNNRGS